MRSGFSLKVSRVVLLQVLTWALLGGSFCFWRRRRRAGEVDNLKFQMERRHDYEPHALL